MPQAKFKSIFQCSSEDSKYPASNLINEKGKWKCKKDEESTNFVVLSLEKPQKIIGIDIVNEHSAFVEVLVGKSEQDPVEYKTILHKCSFMTLIESRNSENPNRVRCFTKNALIESVLDDEWDLIKVECSQPYYQRAQYGLSVVTVHVKEQEKKDFDSPSPQKKGNATFIGKFKLRDESSDSDDNGPSMFEKWKQSQKTKETFTTAAAIRAASSTPAATKPDPKPQTSKAETSSKEKKTDRSFEIKDRNRKELTFDEDDKPKEKFHKKFLQEKERLKALKEDSVKPTPKKAGNATSSKNSSFKKFLFDDDEAEDDSRTKKPEKVQAHTRKPTKSPSPPPPPAKKTKVEKPKIYKPLNKLLQGVVLVISGIQNPERGVLREQATKLGAKYKPDWDGSCTHLICAFKNTPKYNQVKGEGKIVTKYWITKCFEAKKRIPWRRYALDAEEMKQPESDEEIYDISLKPPEATVTSKEVEKEKTSDVEMGESSKPPPSRDESPKRNITPVKPPASENIEDESPKRQKASTSTDAVQDSPKKQSTPIKHPQKSPKTRDSPSPTFSTNRGAYINCHPHVDPAVYEQLKWMFSALDERDKKDTEADVQSSSDTDDTDDDIRNALKKQKITIAEHKNDVSTDEDETFRRNSPHPDNTEFFKDIKIFIAREVKVHEYNKLKEYIEKFGGEVVEDFKSANYIVALQKRPEYDFGGCPPIVVPKWVHSCYDMESLVPARCYPLE